MSCRDLFLDFGKSVLISVTFAMLCCLNLTLLLLNTQ